MSTKDEALETRESALLLAQFIEFGTRRGLLGPGGLPYTREQDGSVSLIVAASHGRFHLAPHSVATRTPLILTAWKKDGAKPLLRANSGLTWDAGTKEWSFYGRRGTDEACGVLWQVLEAMAKRIRWKIPKVG
jgi:hypothetical protein